MLYSMEFGEQIEVVKKDATEDIHHIPKPARSARLISVSHSSEYRALEREPTFDYHNACHAILF